MFFCTLPSLLSSDVYIRYLFIIQSRVLLRGLPICCFSLFFLQGYLLGVYHHDLSILLDVLWWDWLTVVYLFVRYTVGLVYFINSPALRVRRHSREAVRTHNPIASWTPLVESSGASHIPAVRSGLPLSSWNSAGVPCWEPAPDVHLTSTLDVICALLTQPCWWYRPPDVQHSVTVPSQWLGHVLGAACRRLSGMHRHWRRSVASLCMCV